MDMTEVIESAAKAAWEEPQPEDYTGEDGLLYCGKCHTRKQGRFNYLGKVIMVHHLCRCEAEKRQKEEEERQLREKKEQIARMKATCIQDRGLMESTFANDDGSLPQIASAKRYVETWSQRRDNNDGLLRQDLLCGVYCQCTNRAGHISADDKLLEDLKSAQRHVFRGQKRIYRINDAVFPAYHR